MSWYIGQEIVCIKSHSRGVVKKGQIYTIQGLMKSPCKCSSTLIDVGASLSFSSGVYCTECGAYTYPSTFTYWISETLFAPLADISELLEIIEKQPEKINI